MVLQNPHSRLKCLPITTKEGKSKTVKTPTQRQVITDEVFDLKDMIYLRKPSSSSVF